MARSWKTQLAWWATIVGAIVTIAAFVYALWPRSSVEGPAPTKGGNVSLGGEIRAGDGARSRGGDVDVQAGTGSTGGDVTVNGSVTAGSGGPGGRGGDVRIVGGAGIGPNGNG